MEIINILIIILVVVLVYYEFKDTLYTSYCENKNRTVKDGMFDEYVKCKRKPITTIDQTEALYHPDYREIYTLTQNLLPSNEFDAKMEQTQFVVIPKRHVYSLAKQVLYDLEKKTGTGYLLVDVDTCYKTPVNANQIKFSFNMTLKKQTPQESSSKIIVRVVVLQVVECYHNGVTPEFKEIQTGKLFSDNTAPIFIESLTILGYINPDNPFYHELEGATNENQYCSFKSCEEDKNEIVDPQYVRKEVIHKKRDMDREFKNYSHLYPNIGNYDDMKPYYTADSCDNTSSIGVFKKEGDEEEVQVCTKFGTNMVT